MVMQKCYAHISLLAFLEVCGHHQLNYVNHLARGYGLKFHVALVIFAIFHLMLHVYLLKCIEEKICKLIAKSALTKINFAAH